MARIREKKPGSVWHYRQICHVCTNTNNNFNIMMLLSVYKSDRLLNSRN